jgi:hypothetical protein
MAGRKSCCVGRLDLNGIRPANNEDELEEHTASGLSPLLACFVLASAFPRLFLFPYSQLPYLFLLPPRIFFLLYPSPVRIRAIIRVLTKMNGCCHGGD